MYRKKASERERESEMQSNEATAFALNIQRCGKKEDAFASRTATTNPWKNINNLKVFM